MKRLTHLSRISLMLAVFFALDKGLAILRQIIIARIFRLSPELDAFNAANNLPDLLFALISGGALAIAFIPVLSEYLTKRGQPAAWELFSRIANLAFVVTAGLAVIIAAFAHPLVGWQLGVAPGFGPDQQRLVAELMRLNLIATLIFSLSGLVMAGLQANQHFLLPAIAPLLYNLGQIFGALVLSPKEGLHLGALTLPGFGLGVYGLVYGVIAGAALHLAIQIPGLLRYHFRWTPAIGLRSEGVRQVLRLLGPRLLTMLFIQLIFIARDNLASRLETGAVSALTYGWMLLQVPETLIGTAIGTAMLPTLAEQVARGEWEQFHRTVERALQVLLALTLPIAAVLSLGLGPLIEIAFKFGPQGSALLLWTTRAFMVGLLGQSFLEVASRSFYAQQEARLPLLASGLNLVVFVLLAALALRILGAPGIALAISISFTLEALFLLFLLQRRLPARLSVVESLARTLLAAAAGGGLVFLLMAAIPIPPLPLSIAAMAVGGVAFLPFVWREVRFLSNL
jgi:putative peptidoglycan lipid II flippase